MLRAASWIERHLEEVVCGLLMSVMVISIFGQIVMRSIFSAPFVWAEEVSIYSFIWFLYIGASYAVRERAHIRVLGAILLLSRLPRNAVLVISDLVWLALTGWLFFLGLELVKSMSSRSFYSPALGLHQMWTYSILPIGFGLMFARLLQVYWIWFRQGIPPFAEIRSGNK